MIHKQKNIQIDNHIISVDEELADVILKLNELGYKTSGCCIGDKRKNNALWINIQETNESKIAELMNMLNECGYCMEKDLYKKNGSNTIYVQYILKSPEISLIDRKKIIKEWLLTLNKITEINIYTYKILQYKTIRELFSNDD